MSRDDRNWRERFLFSRIFYKEAARDQQPTSLRNPQQLPERSTNPSVIEQRPVRRSIKPSR
jgi:hypothetical protein